MAALEKVMQMRQQGLSERQIIDSLKNQGVTPKDINDALSQSQIKSAINIENQEQNIMPQDNYAQSNPSNDLALSQPQNQQMQNDFANQEQLAMNTATRPIDSEFSRNPMQQSIMTQEAPQEQNMPLPIQPQFTREYQPEQQYQEQYNSQEPYPEYEYQQQINVETITDIAEQIIDEKIEKLKNQTSLLIKTKEDMSIKIEKINQRLEKIENLFNELQMAILGRIGNYSQDLQSISHELRATQDTFSKILNPTIDRQRINQNNGFEELPPPPENSIHRRRGRPRKDAEDFETFLR